MHHQADEQAYVLSSNTEDVEMQDVEEEVDDEDDEEAIASELDPEEGETRRLHSYTRRPD
jgi:hypothetical protein